MNPQKQVDFIHRAVRALGYSDHTTTAVAEAIELAYRQGLSDGYDKGLEDGKTFNITVDEDTYVSGYQAGYDAAMDAMQGDAQPDVAWDDFMEDERYEAGC